MNDLGVLNAVFGRRRNWWFSTQISQICKQFPIMKRNCEWFSNQFISITQPHRNSNSIHTAVLICETDKFVLREHKFCAYRHEIHSRRRVVCLQIHHSIKCETNVNSILLPLVQSAGWIWMHCLTESEGIGIGWWIKSIFYWSESAILALTLILWNDVRNTLNCKNRS